MHELAITQSLLDLVLEEAAKAGASKVLKINVVLGEMSGVVDQFVEFNFDLLSKDTAAEAATISFQNIPKQARCRKCNHVFHPEDICWSCPNCQSTELEMIAGNELYVESIEVE